MVQKTQDVEIKLCFFPFFKTASSSLKYESYDVSLGVRMWHIAVRFTYHVNEDTPVLQGLELWSFLCFIVCRHSFNVQMLKLKFRALNVAKAEFLSAVDGPTKASFIAGTFGLCRSSAHFCFWPQWRLVLHPVLHSRHSRANDTTV